MAKMHEKAMKEETKDTEKKPEEKIVEGTPVDPKAAADKLVKE